MLEHPGSNIKSENIFINAKNYKAQFIPYINLKGEKEVYVNCFNYDEKEWKRRLVPIWFVDGSFWLQINLTQDKMDAFHVTFLI